jgi:transposase InsO family protein
MTDITYIRTGQGWLYLAVVMDLFSRLIVGCAAAPTIHRELVTECRADGGAWLESDAGAARSCSSLCIRSNELEQLILHLVNFTRIIEGSRCQLSAKRNGRNQICQLVAAHILPELSPFLSRL